MKHKIQMWMVNYLRKQGWIVFWLEEQSRYCSGYDHKGVCWMSELVKSNTITAA